MTVAGLAAKPKPEKLAAGRNPFKGFEPYVEDDSAFFFGRERERKIVSANLRASRLTLLYGASGVGKTSLLRAGVVHELRERARADVAAGRELEFAIVYFGEWSDWSHDPVRGIVRAANAEVSGLRRAGLRTDPVPQPRTGRSLYDHLALLTKRVPTLLVILDQFESYFVYNPTERDDDPLVSELPRVVNTPGFGVNLLIAVREDALASLDRFKGRIPRLFDNYLRLGHLQADQAREAIHGPIGRYNAGLRAKETPFAVDEELVDAVVDGVRTDELAIGQRGRGVAAEDDGRVPQTFIETAYLQLVMDRVWEVEKRDPVRRLRRETLDELGGPRTIALTHVGAKLNDLPADDQPLAAKMFDRLVTPSGTKIAQRDADLAEWAGVTHEEIKPLLDRLSLPNVRILRPVPAPSGSPADARHELFHDVLVSGILEWSRRYEERRQRDEVERQRTERRLQRIRLLRSMSVVLALGLLAMVALSVLAVRERDRATRHARAVDANALAAEALSDLVGSPQRAFNEARAAVTTAETPQGDDALRAVLLTSRLRRIVPIPAASKVARLSPSGDLLLTASTPERAARVWQVAPRRRVAVLEGQSVSDARFSRDGAFIVTTDRNMTAARVWGVRSRRWVGGVLEHGAGIAAVAISSDGGAVVTFGADGRARLWETSSGSQIATVRAPTERSVVLDVALTAGGRELATGSDDGTVRIWRLNSRPRTVRLLEGRHRAAVQTVAFSTDGNWLVTGGDDGTARVWSVVSGKQVAVLQADRNAVSSASFDRSGARVITIGEDDGLARVWHWRRSNARPILLGGRETAITGAAFTADGVAVTVDRDGSVVLWQARSPELIVPGWHAKPADAPAPVLSGDGRLIALAAHDGTIQITRAEAGSEVRMFRPRTTGDSLLAIALNPTGTRLAGVAADGEMFVWDLSPSTIRLSRSWSGEPSRHLTFSADGELLLAVGVDGAARAWRIRAAGRPTLLRRHDSIVAGSFSRDGTRIVIADDKESARISHWPSGNATTILHGKVGVVTDAEFSPRGTVVVTTEADGDARLWGASTGLSIGVIHQGARDPLSSAAFAPDGRHILLARRDGSILVYSCDVCGERKELLQLVRVGAKPGTK